MTPGPSHQIQGLKDYQPTGWYGIPIPSTYVTGTNQWPWSSNLLMHHQNTNAAPRLGRAPWTGLAHILEEWTGSLSPPPIDLGDLPSTSNKNQTNSPTPTSPRRFESSLTSPQTLTPKKTNEDPENSSGLSTKGKKTPLIPTAPILSGQNSPQSIERSWDSPDPTHGTFNEEMSKNASRTTSPVPERRWTSTSPSTEENPSTLLESRPSRSESWRMLGGPLGILHRVEDYSIFDPKPLTSKAPWSTPSPILYGRSDQSAPGPPTRFPCGYVATPQPLPNSPPNYWQQGSYRGRGTSRLVAGGDHKMGAGGSG